LQLLDVIVTAIDNHIGKIHRVMAITAIFRGFNMIGILTGRSNPIMTSLARQDYLAVVDLQCRTETIACRMTGATHIRGVGMYRIVGRTLRTASAIMASGLSTRLPLHGIMVESGIGPWIRCSNVACITLELRWNMVGWLVMTGRTGTQNVGMINIGIHRPVRA
jgi:hypothetical protein